MLIRLPDHFDAGPEGPILHINVPLIVVALALAAGTIAVPLAIAWRLFH